MTNLGFPRIDKFRAKFLLETIENLKEDLKRINITLIITIGDPVEELIRVISQQKIKNIFFQPKKLFFFIKKICYSIKLIVSIIKITTF